MSAISGSSAISALKAAGGVVSSSLALVRRGGDAGSLVHALGQLSSGADDVLRLGVAAGAGTVHIRWPGA